MPGPVVGTFATSTLAANDDGSTGLIQLPFSVNFFGTTYSGLYVNNNGNLTFNGAYHAYTPFTGYTGQPILAAYFADVDTRGAQSGLVSYGAGTYNGHAAFGVEYPHVGYYSGQDNHLNTFEIILVNRGDTGAGNFDIYFNYNSITWETGSASGGSGGFGGTPAAAGISSGGSSPVFVYQFPGSMVSRNLTDGGPNALASHTNDGVPGQYLFEVRGGQVSTGAGGTVDLDPPPPPRAVYFSVNAPWQAEGNQGITPFNVVIHRGGGGLGTPSQVNWEVTGADPSDYAPGQTFAGVVEFGAGQTEAVVTLNVLGDRTAEPDEWFNFALTNVTHGGVAWGPGASATGAIMNDDPRVSFGFPGPVMRMEGAAGVTPFEFMVVRSGELSSASTVRWTVEFGTADARDFAPGQALSGEATFAVGAAQATIQVGVAGDLLAERDETFTIKLVSATTSAVTTTLDVSTTGTILDDDVRQTLLVGSLMVLVAPEGDSGFTSFNFTVIRVGDVSAAASTPFAIGLAGATATSAAEIHSPMTGVVSFAAGAASATLTVDINADTTPEADETFTVTLGGGDFNTLTLTGVVMNDDKAVGAPPAAAVSSATPDESASAFMQHLIGGGLWTEGAAL